MNLETPEIRYIKLGEGGCWEQDCLQGNGTIRMGYESDQHAECLAGDWDAVWKYWFEARGNSGTATNDVTQIRYFYELPETTVWITFHGGLMYWCNAADEVIELTDKSRERKTINKWSPLDMKGQLLRIAELDGRITKVQAFRGTICKVQRPDYVWRRIQGLQEPEVIKARDALTNLQACVADLIKGLWWGDFELLVDLILTNSGWRRVSLLGKTQKSLDLELVSPSTGRRAFVQVKSSANQTTYHESIEQFLTHDHDEMYFVCHTFSGERNDPEMRGVHFWGIERLSELVCNLGLTDWLIRKRK